MHWKCSHDIGFSFHVEQAFLSFVSKTSSVLMYVCVENKWTKCKPNDFPLKCFSFGVEFGQRDFAGAFVSALKHDFYVNSLCIFKRFSFLVAILIFNARKIKKLFNIEITSCIRYCITKIEFANELTAMIFSLCVFFLCSLAFWMECDARCCKCCFGDALFANGLAVHKIELSLIK